MPIYRCPKCGATWTEDELYEDQDDNEDMVTFFMSIGQCPECYEGEYDGNGPTMTVVERY